MIKDKLDKRICDVEGGDNEETYREFIKVSEIAFELEHKDLDSMSDEDLGTYIQWLDYLWTK